MTQVVGSATQAYAYPTTSNQLSSIAEAGAATRSFTHDSSFRMDTLSDFEKCPQARRCNIGIGRFDRPFPGIVGDKGDMSRLARSDQHIVAPIGLPAVVQRMKQAPDVASDPHGLDRRGLVDEPERDRRAPRGAKEWLLRPREGDRFAVQ